MIDISGDGADNDSPSGLLPAGGRNNALANGVTTINGLVIGGSPSVADYYTNNVIGGVAPQLFQANDFNDFNDSIRQKIFREVNPIPEPGTWVLLGSGLLLRLFVRRIIPRLSR